MKKTLFFIILFTLTLTLSSCSKDEVSEDSLSAKLIGTWIGKASSLNNVSQGVPDNNILKFSQNRTEFIYEKFGNNGEDISEFGDWSLSGNTLTISWDESDPGLETLILEILILNDANLKWKEVLSPNDSILIEEFSKQ